MGRKRHTAEQIIHKLREAEVELAKGQSTAEVCRKLGIAEQTYYRWRQEYGGLRVDQARRLRRKKGLMRTRKLALVATFVTIFSAIPAAAEVSLPSVLSDGMVFQRNAKLPVWGNASPRERVTVSLAGNSATSVAGTDGRWKVNLGPLQAGGPLEMTVRGLNTIVVRDLLIGEVWICAGQSNMEWPVRKARDADAEIASASYPEMRIFTPDQIVSPLPLKDSRGRWKAVTPKSIPRFSAVGYFFGREIHRTLGVPVGLLDLSKGDTAAEVWMSREVLESDKDFLPILERWDSASPPHAFDDPHTPTGLYNGMIAPVQPFAIRGVIWYQGESNDDRAEQYRKLFPALIRSWRREWGQGSFPFLYVQLANLNRRFSMPTESSWAELREAQLWTLAVPNTAMAVAIDLGEEMDIHPPNKQDVATRLALAAKALVYGRDVVYSGPLFRSAKFRGGEGRVRFDHTDGGLVALGGGPLRGFAVAGEDREFEWADAVIEGTEVVVRSAKVPDPVAIRYAWSNNPDCNLGNRAGLPASPFRTDDWPGLTTGKR